MSRCYVKNKTQKFFLLSQKHIRQTRTDRTLQDGEEPSKNQVSKNNIIYGAPSQKVAGF